MAIAISLQNVNADDNIVQVAGKLVFSGNYSTGGDTLDFSGVNSPISVDPAFQGLYPFIPSSGAPTDLDVWSVNGNLQFQYVPIQGSTLANSKVKLSASATFGTELAAGAYPAGVTGDVVNFYAQFKKLQ